MFFAVWGWGSGQAHRVALQLHRDHTSRSLRLYYGAPAPVDELQGPGQWEARVGTGFAQPQTQGDVGFYHPQVVVLDVRPQYLIHEVSPACPVVQPPSL